MSGTPLVAQLAELNAEIDPFERAAIGMDELATIFEF